MTFFEEREIIERAIEMTFRNFTETEVENYVFEACGKNPYIFKDVYQKLLFRLEFVE